VKVLITGAAGFLASHVADAFAKSGAEVVVFDLAPNRRYESITGDLLDPADLEQAVKGMDVVCHLAAIGDVYLAAEKPALAAAVNVTGTTNVCHAALAEGTKVVLASTWEVYGEPKYDPIDEDHPCNPDHPYSITKLAGERMALAYHRLKGLPVVALRLGTAYGTRMRPNSVFSLFIDRALRGEPLVIHGSGTQTRQFTHASDIGAAFVAAAASNADSGVFNIVAERGISIRELAEHVASIVPTTVSFGPSRPGDVPSARVSSARAHEALRWRATADFSTSLSTMVDERRVYATTSEGAVAR
jgi:UDP-glucose 4-epimerase